MEHSGKESEIAGLKQSHVQGEKNRREDKCKKEPAHIAQGFSWQPCIGPQAAYDDKQIAKPGGTAIAKSGRIKRPMRIHCESCCNPLKKKVVAKIFA